MKFAAALLGACVSAASAASATVNDAMLANFNTFAQFANAAYCSVMSDGTTGSSLCDGKSCFRRGANHACAELQDATTVAEFTDADSVNGNVAVSKARKLIVLSVRGTVATSLRDVMSDAKLCPRKPRGLLPRGMLWGLESACSWLPSTPEDTKDKLLPICEGCLVHSGFWTAFTLIKNEILAAVRKQVKANPGYTVVATGHSLGAAVATIAGAYLRKAGIKTDIYTYGSPRVGDEAFARFVSEQPNGKTYRITNRADPITVIPGAIAGYAHTVPEYWFPMGLEQPKNMSTCGWLLRRKCSAQHYFNPMQLADHLCLGYTRGIEACPNSGRMMFGDLGREDISQDDVKKWEADGVLGDDTSADDNRRRRSTGTKKRRFW